jgi:alpha-beta hydrolase superfamily lysophospholipase
MSRGVKILIIVVVVLAVAVAAILAGMLAFGAGGTPQPLASLSAPFHAVNFGDLPAVQTLAVGNRSPIAYRAWLPSTAASNPPLVVIAIHGSSAQSASIHPLGKALSAEGIPVFAPDIRGHGDTGVRGDIDYASELDDDTADFVATVRGKYPTAKLVLMGFSSGGGYALHVAATPLGKNFARAVLLSPMLGPFSPTYNHDQKYATPFIPRIMALALLDRVGIHAFDHLTTLLLAIDPSRTDILVGHYSWLLMRAFGTNDYAADLRNAQTPLALVAGEKDELFYADKFAPTLNAIKSGIPVTIVPGLSHTALTVDPSAVPAILAAVRGPG